jgi:hypothetical protein
MTADTWTEPETRLNSRYDRANGKTGSGYMKPCVPRIVAICLLLGATATLVAGCGGDAASASETATEQAETRLFAGTVNLGASDLPGFKVALEAEGSSGPLDRPIEECDGGPIFNAANHGVVSPLLQKQKVPVQTVSSEVYRTLSPSFASGYITAADGRRGLGCVQREEIRKRARLGSLARGRIEVVALRPPLVDTPVSGVRVWRCLPGSQPCNSRGDRSFTDRLWFAAGPYVVALFYIAGPENEAKGPEPLALPLERQLIALLYSRAQARKP